MQLDISFYSAPKRQRLVAHRSLSQSTDNNQSNNHKPFSVFFPPIVLSLRLPSLISLSIIILYIMHSIHHAIPSEGANTFSIITLAEAQFLTPKPEPPNNPSEKVDDYQNCSSISPYRRCVYYDWQQGSDGVEFSICNNDGYGQCWNPCTNKAFEVCSNKSNAVFSNATYNTQYCGDINGYSDFGDAYCVHACWERHSPYYSCLPLAEGGDSGDADICGLGSGCGYVAPVGDLQECLASDSTYRCVFSYSRLPSAREAATCSSPDYYCSNPCVNTFEVCSNAFDFSESNVDGCSDYGSGAYCVHQCWERHLASDYTCMPIADGGDANDTDICGVGKGCGYLTPIGDFAPCSASEPNLRCLSGCSECETPIDAASCESAWSSCYNPCPSFQVCTLDSTFSGYPSTSVCAEIGTCIHVCWERYAANNYHCANITDGGNANDTDICGSGMGCVNYTLVEALQPCSAIDLNRRCIDRYDGEVDPTDLQCAPGLKCYNPCLYEGNHLVCAENANFTFGGYDPALCGEGSSVVCLHACWDRYGSDTYVCRSVAEGGNPADADICGSGRGCFNAPLGDAFAICADDILKRCSLLEGGYQGLITADAASCSTPGYSCYNPCAFSYAINMPFCYPVTNLSTYVAAYYDKVGPDTCNNGDGYCVSSCAYQTGDPYMSCTNITDGDVPDSTTEYCGSYAMCKLGEEYGNRCNTNDHYRLCLPISSAYELQPVAEDQACYEYFGELQTCQNVCPPYTLCMNGENQDYNYYLSYSQQCPYGNSCMPQCGNYGKLGCQPVNASDSQDPEDILNCGPGMACKEVKSKYDFCSLIDAGRMCLQNSTYYESEVEEERYVCEAGTYCNNPCGAGFMCFSPVESNDFVPPNGTDCGIDSYCISLCGYINGSYEGMECRPVEGGDSEDSAICGAGSGKRCYPVISAYEPCSINMTDPSRTCVWDGSSSAIELPGDYPCGRGYRCDNPCGRTYKCSFTGANRWGAVFELCGGVGTECTNLCSSYPEAAPYECSPSTGDIIDYYCGEGYNCSQVSGHMDSCAGNETEHPERFCSYVDEAEPLPPSLPDDLPCIRGTYCTNPCGDRFMCGFTSETPSNDAHQCNTAEGPRKCFSTCELAYGDSTNACSPIDLAANETEDFTACSAGMTCKPALDVFEFCSFNNSYSLRTCLALPYPATEYSNDTACMGSYTCANPCGQLGYFCSLDGDSFNSYNDMCGGADPNYGVRAYCGNACLLEGGYGDGDNTYECREVGAGMSPDEAICGPGMACTLVPKYNEVCSFNNSDPMRRCLYAGGYLDTPAGLSNDTQCVRGTYCGTCQIPDYVCGGGYEVIGGICGDNRQCTHTCMNSYGNSSLRCIPLWSGETDEPDICGAGRRCGMPRGLEVLTNATTIYNETNATLTETNATESNTTDATNETIVTNATTVPANTSNAPTNTSADTTNLTTTESETNVTSELPNTTAAPTTVLPTNATEETTTEVPNSTTLVATTSGATTNPTTSDATTNPTTSDATTNPTTSDATTNPTTSGVTTNSATATTTTEEAMSTPEPSTTPTATSTSTVEPASTTSITTAATSTSTTTKAPTQTTTYLSTTGYGTRYPNYVPTELTGLVSGVPLTFSTTYQTIYSRRFLSTRAASRVLRQLIAVDYANNRTVTVGLAVTRTTGAADYYSLNRTRPTGWVDINDNSIILSNMSNQECSALMTAVPLQIATLAAGMPMPVRLEAGTQAMVSQCKQAYLWSGMAYSTAPFTRSPALSYIYSFAVSTGASVPSNADLLASFLSQGWSGDASETFRVTSFTSAFAFTGNTTAPTQRYIALMAPSNRTGASVSGQAIVVSSNTSRIAGCHGGDMFSYDGLYVPASTSLSQGSPTLCYTFDTTDDLHYACDQRSDCAGFTTIRMPGPKEMPLCLYTKGTAPASDTMAYQRMFYTKPDQAKAPGCQVLVKESGRVAISIQQTYLATGAVTIKVNGIVAAVCGQEKPFSNNVMGSDGRCNVYTLCTTQSVSAGSIVEVNVGLIGLRQSGCENSLGALVEQVSIDQVQVPATTEAPIPTYDVSSLSSRYVLSTALESRSLKVFTYRATQATLQVLQTGYSCGTSCNSSITFSSSGSCQTCGAAKGFYSGRAGLSDRCDTYQFCDSMMSVGYLSGSCSANAALATPSTSPYSGILTATADASQLNYVSGICTGFQAYILASSDGSTSVPVFPLRETSGQQRTLLGAAISASSSELAGLLGVTAGDVSSVTQLTSIGSVVSPLGAYYVPWDTLYGGDSPSAHLNANSTQVCIVDHAEETEARCVFYIPKGATKVKVSAAQIDFASSTMSVEIYPLGSTASSTTSCGGASKKFGTTYGQQERCDTYLNCIDQYIYTDDSLAASNEAGYVTVTIPSTMLPRSCNFTAVVTAAFSLPLSDVVFAGCNSSEFECPDERKCLALSQVCDGVQDCSANADEDSCTGWVALPNEAFCVPANSSLTYGPPAVSFAECRRLAILASSTGFSLGSDGVCSVYTAEMMVSLLDTPADYVCDATGTTTFLLLDDPYTFGLCRSTIQCNGKGAAATVGETCVCTCAEGYLGSDCSERLSLDGMKVVVVSVSLPSLDLSSSISLTALAVALALRSNRITLTCDGLTPRNATIVDVSCWISASVSQAEMNVHFRRLLTSAAVAAVNSLLDDNLPRVALLSVRTTMNPLVEMPTCNTSDTGVSTCNANLAFDKLQINIVANVTVRSATVTVSDGDSGSSGSRSGRRTVTATCTPAATYIDSGCYRSSCTVNMSGISGSVVTVEDTVYDPEDLLTMECEEARVSTSAYLSYGNLPTATTDTVQTSETDYGAYLIGAIVLFLVGTLVFWFVAAACLVSYRRQKKAALLAVDFSGMTDVERTKAAMLVDLAYERELDEERRVHSDRWAVGFLATGLLTAVGASFLAIYYATGYGLESNFQVLYEEYSDAQCSSSQVSYMPTRIFAVPEGSYECSKMQSTGESAGVAYATGECSGSGGSYTVSFTIGNSKSSCDGATTATLPSGTCMPIQALLPQSTRNVYVQLQCSTSAQVRQRAQQLQTLTKASDVFVTAPTTAATSGTTLNATVDTGAELYSVSFLAGSVIGSSTSHYSNTLDSQALPTGFDGDFDTSRIVMQSTGCTFQSYNAADCLATIADTLTTEMADLSGTQAAKLGPTTDDAPIGFVFNGFGTSSQNTWALAGTQAHRYYGASGSAFDMGVHFPVDTSSPEDYEGYTVSMYMLADEGTQGFAYAVCDAFEHLFDGTIYPLQRLGDIIANGQSGAAWFNDTFKVYQALYVDGPGRSLTFAYASPTLDEPLHLLEFDLSELGLERAVNGQWHHIAVSFLVENGRVRAQLMVDGESSYSQAGWSVCVSEFPEPITDFSTTAPVYDLLTDTVTRGGMVVTGYFNGGVHSVQAIPKPQYNTDFLQMGTQAMRDNNPFPRTKTLTLAIVLISLTFAFLVFLVISGAIGLRAMSLQLNVRLCRSVASTFYGLLMEATTIVKQSKHGKEVGVLLVSKDGTDVLTPLRFCAALRWLKLDIAELTAVIDEIKAQTSLDDSCEALLLMLMKAKTGDTTMTNFSVRDWNELVAVDAKAHAEWKFLCFSRTSDADKEKVMCGSDVFDGIMCNAEQEADSPGKFRNVQVGDIKVKVDTTAYTNTTAASGATQQGTAGTHSQILNVIAPLIGVFQGMYVWATSIQFPNLYDDYFRSFFSFVSVDFTSAFDNVSTLVTPIMQLCVGLAAVCFVLYYMYEDNKHFERILSQYVWRRDELETESGKVMKQLARLPPHLPTALADTRIPEPMLAMEALPVGSSRRVDLLEGRIQKVHDEDTTDYAKLTEVIVTTVQGNELVVAKSGPNSGKMIVKQKDGDGFATDLKAVGVCCQRHPETRLSPQTQSQIWPFANPPTCCLVVNGRLCGEQSGVVYSCGSEYTDEETGDLRVCNYALCDTHCRLSPPSLVLAMAAGFVRKVQSLGASWLICVAVVMLCNFAYTPVMKTALMIIGCHPYYQCEFEHCWEGIDQKFALAAFCSITIIVLFGVGYPCLTFLLLHSRKRSMDVTFVAPEYEGKYASKEGGLFGKAGSYISEREWSRFVSTDTTALAQQYQQVYYRWIFFSSITIVFRVAALIPAIFIEPRTFEQRLGCAIVQLVVTSFMFGTTTQLSPVVLLTLRAAEVHNLAILGLQNLSLVLLNDSNTDISSAMIVVTIVYLVFTAIVFAIMIGAPLFSTTYRTFGLSKFLAKYGYDYSEAITLYLNPYGDTSKIPELAKSKLKLNPEAFEFSFEANLGEPTATASPTNIDRPSPRPSVSPLNQLYSPSERPLEFPAQNEAMVNVPASPTAEGHAAN